MQRTYFTFSINNYILLLHWGNFVLTFYSHSYIELAKELQYDLDNYFNYCMVTTYLFGPNFLNIFGTLYVRPSYAHVLAKSFVTNVHRLN